MDSIFQRLNTAAESTAVSNTAIETAVESIDTKTPALVGGATPVTAASLPLPSGAATELSNQAIEVAVEAILARTAELVAGASPIAVRRDSEDGTAVDGGVTPLFVNQVGRLKVAAMPGMYAAIVGNITASGQSVSAAVDRASNVMIHCTGTFTGSNCTFEGSIDGGTTWFAVQAVRTNANTIELTTGVLGGTPAYAWELSVNGMTNVRVRATAFTSGTQTWRILPGAYATEPIPAMQTHAVTGSGTFTVDSELPAAAALADGAANPTAPQVGADNLLWNGATWDRQRNNADVTVDGSAARTASVAGGTQTNHNARGALITILFGAVTGTSPTLAVQLQWSPNGGTTWLNYGPTTFPAATPANGNTWVLAIYPNQKAEDTSTTLGPFTIGSTVYEAYNAPLPRVWRLNYTIGGTTPSITFSALASYLL